ncbi:UDP-N-acetylenolpyruvoylglucosamine reductase [compost metagenome]
MTQLLKQFDLSTLNTLGLSSKAEFYAEVAFLSDFQSLLKDPSSRSLKWSLLGGGSNLVLPPEVNGLVLKVAHKGKSLAGQDADAWFVKVSAGENWHEFVQWALSQGYWGLENLSLIPGTAGAAPIQNIGAYGVEVKDLIHEVICLDLSSGETKTFSNADCHFSYRESFFKQEGHGKYMVWEVIFRLPKKNQLHLEYGDIKKEVERLGLEATPLNIAQAVISIRQTRLPDPKVIGNAGSFFKNPIVSKAKRDQLFAKHADLVNYPFGDQYKLAAGWLIDRSGWKGKNLGPVGMFERQALVLVNRGGANAVDVWRLADQVCADVQGQFGVVLEAEPIRW